ncbi:hypothetical protein BWR18_06525 [Tateyamaria omphalii]|uniref:Uncharacterized protein n=1 Tax=Tateyamaria omphalii TaxID=299262 RepID=A0A1P8MTK7_9RHOB|nr:hypothetical protein BWR18_06525 [Tateyamaria omphalii]
MPSSLNRAASANRRRIMRDEKATPASRGFTPLLVRRLVGTSNPGRSGDGSTRQGELRPLNASFSSPMVVGRAALIAALRSEANQAACPAFLRARLAIGGARTSLGSGRHFGSGRFRRWHRSLSSQSVKATDVGISSSRPVAVCRAETICT